MSLGITAIVVIAIISFIKVEKTRAGEIQTANYWFLQEVTQKTIESYKINNKKLNSGPLKNKNILKEIKKAGYAINEKNGKIIDLYGEDIKVKLERDFLIATSGGPDKIIGNMDDVTYKEPVPRSIRKLNVRDQSENSEKL